MRLQVCKYLLILLLLPSLAWAIPAIPTIPAFPTITSGGTEYHVDGDTGSNGGAGTSGDPWETIVYSLTQVSAGDILTVHTSATNYPEYVAISVAGGAWNTAITIQGASGETVTVVGASSGGKVRGFAFTSSSEYVYLKNFVVTASDRPVTVKAGAQYIAIDTTTTTASHTASGFIIGDWYGSTGPDYVWLRDCTSANASGGASDGFYTLAKASNITYIDCTSYNNADDGWGTHLDDDDWDHWPETLTDVITNIYFDGCTTYGNGQSGFDIASAKGEIVFRDVISYDNNDGIKVWNTAWVINCLLYDNVFSCIEFKPFETDTAGNLYALHNTCVDSEYYGFRVPDVNGANAIETANLYLYNNLFDHNNASAQGTNDCMLRICQNGNLSESDYNLFHGKTTSTCLMYDEPTRTYTMAQIATYQSDFSVDGNSVSSTGTAYSGFVDKAHDDYSILSAATVRDVGVSKGVTDDIDGNTRPCGTSSVDIGAYEFSDTITAISGDYPSGTVSCTSDPRNVVMSWATDGTANCRIDTSDKGDYDNATADSVTNTDSPNHDDTESLACDQVVTRYVYCEDLCGNEVGPTTITFTIQEGSPPSAPSPTAFGVGISGTFSTQ